MKKAIALMLLLCPVITFAQTTFQPGYFIEKGNKTECLIKNLAWKNNPESIEYKLTEGDSPKISSAAQIAEFGVDDYIFKAFTVNIDRSSSFYQSMSKDKEPLWTNEKLFLKVIASGDMSLYEYKDNSITKFFYSTETHTSAEQLVFKEYKTDNGIGKNQAFRQQLYQLMKSRIANMERFKKIKYNTSDLTKLFAEYNGDSNRSTKLSDNKKKNFNLKITPGVGFSTLNFSNSAVDLYYDFKDKMVPRIGVEAEYVLPFNNNKWSIFFDPNFQSYTDSGNHQDGTFYETFKADFKMIELPIGIRHYMYLTAPSRLFVDVAYVPGITLDSYIDFNDSERKLDISKRPNFALGAGYAYSNYSIEVRYNFRHNLLDNYIFWKSEYSSLNIILGYKVF